MKLAEAIELLTWANTVWERIAQETGLTVAEVQEVVERWEAERPSRSASERQESGTLAKLGIALGHAPYPPHSLCIHEWRMTGPGQFMCSKCGELKRAFWNDDPNRPLYTSPRSPSVEVWVDE